MKKSTKTGLSFGLTSGIITTLGLIVGLNAGTGSRLAVVGGILTIAIADAFSDALGIHTAEESQKENSMKQIWESTVATFLAKFFFALTFLIPILLFDLSTAIIVSVAWGLLVLGVYSFKLSKDRKMNSMRFVIKHLSIAILVVIITYFVGKWIGLVFV
tara:strand:- start:1245 stop:1721 length:477 start_codon:yes stop_codon:yes gene_type:complete